MHNCPLEGVPRAPKTEPSIEAKHRRTMFLSTYEASKGVTEEGFLWLDPCRARCMDERFGYAGEGGSGRVFAVKLNATSSRRDSTPFPRPTNYAPSSTTALFPQPPLCQPQMKGCQTSSIPFPVFNPSGFVWSGESIVHNWMTSDPCIQGMQNNA